MKQEWQSIFTKKKMMIILFGIALIPTLYTVIFLSSMWDPYGKLANLPVAVVNEDKAVTYNDENLAIGDNLVEELEDSDAMDFEFVSKADAEAGLADGDYYMVITIPEDFSENATTLLADDPKQMTLDYETSAGHSYIASKLTSSAANTLKDSVSNEVTKIYAETIFSQLQTVADKMQEAADGGSQITDGVETAADGNETITENLETLASSSLTFADGADTLNVGLNTYTDGVSQVNEGARALNEGTSELTESMPALTSGVSQLTSGAGDLADGSATLSAGLTTLSTNTVTLADGASSLNDGMVQLAEGSQALTDGLAQLNTSLTSEEQAAKIAALQTGLDQMQAGLDTLDTSLQNSTLAGDLSDVTDQLAGLSTSVADVQTQLTNIVATADPTSNTDAVLTAIEASGAALTPEQEAAVSTAVSNQFTSVASEQATSAQTIASDLSGLSSLQDIDVTAIASQISSLQTSVSQLADGYDALYDGTNTLIDGVNQVAASSDTLLSGAQTLDEGIDEAQGGAAALSSGMTQLNDGTQTLNAGGIALTDGSSQLSAGLDTLNSQTGTLADGASQLQAGTQALADGSSQLVANSSQLTDGTSQLADGATQIADGSDQLADGSQTLGDGLATIADGTTELSSQLANGSQSLNEVDATDATYDMMAEPVSADQTETAAVANNGTGMAPYMMSVALFVGAISLNLMYDIYSPKGTPKNGVSWWASKFSVLAAVGILQSLIMVILLHTVNGLETYSMSKTILVTIVTALTSISIVMLFNLLFDKIGSFIMLIFLILQLSGSGGTYPIQLSNPFFEAIHPYLPMTYSVDAYRQLFAIGGSIRSDLLVLIAILIIVNLLIILFYTVNNKKIKANQFDTQAAI
ncbi:YhgE/Pip domain-containing protein [Aerococcus agrisoli]|uniref:YhgE/Pip domain-containing protein n=1 Tax=Aerococcus agrisoli TaxID=2487350 RepID=A0A3N4G8R6_9LACT|nr:YhgE/Pip domain-containing protein [Aerococcus agrisoli]RPA59129.1 YhgE/Pip domain-containing protein [Aerococcus agrisoli]